MPEDVHAAVADARVEAARVEARQSQYGTYVQWGERLIDRRAEANRFYLALNSVVVGAIGFLFSDRAELAIVPVEYVAAVFAFIGVVVSWNWRCIIRSQRNIVRSKFKVIQELEELLPASPYTDEWNQADGDRRRVSAGRFELRLPSLFTLLYLAALIWLAIVIMRGAQVDFGALSGSASGFFER